MKTDGNIANIITKNRGKYKAFILHKSFHYTVNT